jgi:hypothetical protein
MRGKLRSRVITTAVMFMGSANLTVAQGIPDQRGSSSVPSSAGGRHHRAIVLAQCHAEFPWIKSVLKPNRNYRKRIDAKDHWTPAAESYRGRAAPHQIAEQFSATADTRGTR